MSRLSRYHLLALLVFAIVLLALVPRVVPNIRERLPLSLCLLTTNENAKRECAFSHIRTVLNEKGVAEALHTFATANEMLPKLDIDCHAAIHRVGDMMYYSIYLENEYDIAPDDFPPEALICNRGFYHGIFEHLFQDRTDPAYISDACHRFAVNDDIRAGTVRYTCFHAAGHGLLRAQSEKIPREDWGNSSAFLTAPVASCNSLPNSTEQERFACITGVESIFIQASMLNEYGLSDPDNGNGLTICNQLPTSLHPTCYFVRSLMMTQMSNSFLPVLRSCSSATEPLFQQCLTGTIEGIVVNGIHEESFNRSLSLCRRPEILRRNDTEVCYQEVINRIEREYIGEYVPRCDLFPEAFRPACRKAIL